MRVSVREALGISEPLRAFFRLGLRFPDSTGNLHQDMLTPHFYNGESNGAFRCAVNRFVYYAQKRPLHHPLRSALGVIPAVSVPAIGVFGAGKGPSGTSQHHAAVDLHVGSGETTVDVFAAHSGYASTYRDAPKYRHYLAISNRVFASSGDVLGTLVTLYAHIDLDLDEADGLRLNGQHVEEGEVVSRHLYSGTVGGPHLHFEIRYYRNGERGDETFYEFVGPQGSTEFTEPSADPWSYGYWNPNIGFGFGDPRNHGLVFY